MSPLVGLRLYESRREWLVRPDDVVHILPSHPHCVVTTRDGAAKLVDMTAREAEAKLWPIVERAP